MKRRQKITGVIILAILFFCELLIWVNAELDLKYIFTPYGIYDIDSYVIERTHLRIKSLSAVIWLNLTLVVVMFVWLWRKGGKK